MYRRKCISTKEHGELACISLESECSRGESLVDIFYHIMIIEKHYFILFWYLSLIGKMLNSQLVLLAIPILFINDLLSPKQGNNKLRISAEIPKTISNSKTRSIKTRTAT